MTERRVVFEGAFTASFDDAKPDDLADGEKLSKCLVLAFESAYFKADLGRAGIKIAGKSIVFELKVSIDP